MSLARILLVDDESDTNGVIKRGLEQVGFHVIAYSNPLEVLRQFKPNQYDMLLLDIKMPQMDGFTLYEKMKEIDKKVKVCFLTAYDITYEETYRKRFPSLGSKCFMRKPISIVTLTKIIKAELGLA